MADQTPPWWHGAVLYQVYPRSYADSDGDGSGDLRGLIDRLDHLAWLGIDGVWLSPITVSPDADWGYDVADYCDVDPDFGDLAVFDELVSEAARREIRILMDLVPNHTSSAHAWFEDARTSRGAVHRDFYVWADGAAPGEPPNNWVSMFGGPAWTFDEASGQWYLHNFLPEQPDLNWWNPEVHAAFDEILAFWWARGVAGFRVDVATAMVKDAELRDNPAAGPEDSLIEQLVGQRFVFNVNRPETHDVLRHWRDLADAARPPRLFIGETNVERVETMASYYGRDADELNLCLNFTFIETAFAPEPLAAVVADTEAALPGGAWPVWTGSNHDVSRLATRWAEGDGDKTRLALVMLLCLRGTALLYQGDEIGLEDGPIEVGDLRDPVGKRFWPAYRGRDPERTPMPWDEAPGRGFSAPGVVPWLPIDYPAKVSVRAQREDPGSVLHLVRDLVALRRRTPDLALGPYDRLDAPPGVWRWRRGKTVTVALNFTDAPARVDGVSGVLALCTDRRTEGQPIDGTLGLGPLRGAVVVADG